jgi:hypothetical protein
MTRSQDDTTPGDRQAKNGPKGDYDVGYCKPPAAHRFKHGNKANPKGRKKGAHNRKIVIREVLFEAVTVREGGEIKQMSALEAVLKKLLSKALAGDNKAALTIEQGVVPSGSTLAIAEERIVSELEKIRQVFDDVAPFMERIEDFRDRLERRVRTTVHYMDVMGEGSAERLARLIERLASMGCPDVELRLRAPDVGFPISSKALYTPPPPRSPPEKSRFKMPQRDPYLKAYVAATTAFDKMVRVTPARLTAFIDAKIADRDQFHSSEISIDSIEELFAFRTLPGLPASSAAAEIGPYRIVLENGRSGNEWINLQAFRVERIAASEVR